MTFCDICGSFAQYTCSICGRSVCEKHYDKQRKLCIYCSITLCELCGERLAVSTCPICGKQVCDECSIQITPVVRVCKECYQSYAISESEWPPSRLIEVEKESIKRISSLTLFVLRGT